MKDASNYFIPIVKDPLHDITGRCVTSNGLDSVYCDMGTYHQSTLSKVFVHNHQTTTTRYPDVQMESNNMEIQYNNLIAVDDYEQHMQMQQGSERLYAQTQNRKRNNCNCEDDLIAKRCRREDTDPSIFPFPDQTSLINLQVPTPVAKCQMHQRQPTHNMPDMPRCMMGHYI